MSFSPDNQLVFAASYKAGLVLVFSVSEPDWRARGEPGLSGAVGVVWGGDSRHLVTMAEWATMVTVWSLASSSAGVQFIRNPKPWITSPETVLHNRDLTYSFIIERREGRDCLNIFTPDWQLVRQTVLDTEDAAGAAWSPASDLVCVWDTSLYYRVQVISLDGRLVWDYSAYEHQLGVRSCAWSPDGRLVAVASYDNRVRIFCSQFWTLVHDIDHVGALHEADPVTSRAVVYNESSVEAEEGDLETRLALEMAGGGAGLFLSQTRYDTVDERPVYLDFTRPDHKKAGAANIRVGVSVMTWSSEGRYLATKCSNLATTVWVWDLASVQLVALLVHQDPVRDLAWDPALPRLALVTGAGASVYIWSPLGALVARVPSVVRGELEGMTEVSWGKRSRDLALSNRGHVVLVHVSSDKKARVREVESDLDLEPSREESSA